MISVFFERIQLCALFFSQPESKNIRVDAVFKSYLKTKRNFCYDDVYPLPNSCVDGAELEQLEKEEN